MTFTRSLQDTWSFGERL